MKQTELVFVPFPVIGHLAPTLEFAKLLTQRDPRFSITIVIMKFPFWSIDSMTSDSDSILFVTLPPVEISSGATTPGLFVPEFLKAQMPLVRDAVHEITRSNSVRLSGFVIDMFCTHMIDVADEFGVPSYLFCSSSAAFLGFLLHLQFLHDYKGLNLDEFKDSDAELEVPSYVNSVPGKVFPSGMFDKEGGGAELHLILMRKFRQAKGIMVNTFIELESHAIHSFSGSTVPPVYPVGPILNTQMGSGGAQQDASTTMSWLDDQPPSSVVFLCFGSMGTFGADQIKEIAYALEHSGHRFLWSLRQPPPRILEFPSDYENIEEVLPEGFLHRTAGVGKVIGWAPQAAVLAHSAVGGFVSHCGWNSLLESIWYGVPVAAWPMFAEQQLNAFQMVKYLKLAVEIKIDYNKDSSDYVVSAYEIENGLRNLMNINNEVRKKGEEMKKISRKAMKDGGSSHNYLGYFIEDMMANIRCEQQSDT